MRLKKEFFLKLKIDSCVAKEIKQCHRRKVYNPLIVDSSCGDPKNVDPIPANLLLPVVVSISPIEIHLRSSNQALKRSS